MNTYTIQVTWTNHDVLSLDDSLTHEQCIKVLDHLKQTHDSTIGINWDVLQQSINYVKGLQ